MATRERIELEVVGKAHAAPTSTVTPFRKLPFKREPLATDDELREYRQMLPLLRRMVADWEKVRSTCPLARKILDGEE